MSILCRLHTNNVAEFSLSHPKNIHQFLDGQKVPPVVFQTLIAVAPACGVLWLGVRLDGVSEGSLSVVGL